MQAIKQFLFSNQTQAAHAIQCNYSNNYYGDQVCQTLEQKTLHSGPTPKSKG